MSEGKYCIGVATLISGYNTEQGCIFVTVAHRLG